MNTTTKTKTKQKPPKAFEDEEGTDHIAILTMYAVWADTMANDIAADLNRHHHDDAQALGEDIHSTLVAHNTGNIRCCSVTAKASLEKLRSRVGHDVDPKAFEDALTAVADIAADEKSERYGRRMLDLSYDKTVAVWRYYVASLDEAGSAVRVLIS